MNKVFAILGSGMQGTASAYDIAKYADPAKLLMGDVSLDQATKAADRVNKLVGRQVAEPYEVDATDPSELEAFLFAVDILVSSVPYHMHHRIAPVAIRTQTNMVDMGGNTEVAMEVLGWDHKAKEFGVSLVPDTGLAPGLVNSLALYCMEQFDVTHDVNLYCGGLPQNPKPPLNYKLVFNIEGLITEYTGNAVVLRDGKVAHVPTLEEVEKVHWDGVGELEAFTTSGGVSTAPFSFEGKVRNYEYKTLRFPGHAAIVKLFKQFGLWDLDQVVVDGQLVVPRHVFAQVVGPKLVDDSDTDQVFVRCVATGEKNGQKVTKQIDIHDKFDPVTGFSAMERLTGFTTAIYAIEIAKGNVPTGCVRYELGLSGKAVVDGMRERGIEIIEK